MANTVHQSIVGGHTNGLLNAFLIQHVVQSRDSKGSVTAQVLRNVAIPVSVDGREENATAELGTVVAPMPEHGPL